MNRSLKLDVLVGLMLLLWMISAAPVFAGSTFTAGARPGPRVPAGGSTRSQSNTADAVPAVVQEITTAFTATPTSGGLGDAVEASRSSFSTGEPIEFNAVLFETGLAGTKASIEVFLFDTKGRLATTSLFATDVSAPADRTGFFLQLNAGSLPTGRYRWLMVIFDVFGNTFVTPFQALDVR